MIGALTARQSVVFDLDNGEVVQQFRSAFFQREKRFKLTDYTHVTVSSGGRGGFSAPIAVYFVELVGRSRLKIGAATGDRNQKLREAETLSDYLSLPLKS